ncbi:MAG: heme-binding protein [Ruminococcaceae bacterium]|nr:heme-binding protein [Oscillospiraceae bacterium]
MDSRDIASVVSKVVASLSSKMTLDIAKALSLCVEKKAQEMGVNAVICVADSGARPILVHSMDNAYIASFDIAVKKAYTVVSLKMPTSKLKTLAAPGGSLYGIQFTNDGQIVIFGGGDPLIINGEIIGGIGVSGGTEEQDTALSLYGASVLEEIIKRI